MQCFLRPLFLVLLCAITACPLKAADWTSYLNGNERAGFSETPLTADFQLKWVHHAPAKPETAWSGPRNSPIEGHVMRHRVNFDAAIQVVTAGNRVYFGSSVDHRLYCVNADDGKPLWDFYTDGPIRLAPTLAHGNVYFGSDDGCVYCLTADEGKLVWSHRVGPKDDRLLSRGKMISRWPVRTGVLIDGDTAYFGAGIFPHEKIFLCAANARNGEFIWRNDTISDQDAGRNDLSPQGYLLANDEHIYVPSGRSLPVAVSKTTGQIVFQKKYSWRSDAGGVVGGTKALLGDGQVYAGGPHHFLAMRDDNGSLGAAWINGRQMVLAGRFAYLMDGERIFCADRQEHAEASKEKQAWFLRARSARSDPAKLATAKENMQKYASVGVIWEHPSEADDALIATEKLVIAGGQGEVLALARDSGKLLWQSKVEGTVCGLAASDSHLLVSTDEGHIYAFHQKDESAAEVKHWPVRSKKTFDDDARTEFFRSAAAEILQRSSQTTGYCLIAGSGDGRLADELARQSQLKILCVEPEADKATRVRKAFERSGLHANRVTVVNVPFDQIPFSNYFANLIVSESHLLSGESPCDAKHVARFLRPCGGVAILGLPKGSASTDMTAAKNWLTGLFYEGGGELVAKGDWHVMRRGKLPGAGDWTHQYGNAANTSFSNDERVRDGLGVLWYGDPGPSAMINRHEAAGAPLSTNGRMFIQGTNSVMAYDAYNGSFLWEYENPGAIRTGVFNNRETHNLAASDDTLFVAVGEKCTALDAATGKIKAEYATPESKDGIERAWAYIAHDNGQLFGTSTIREELERRLRRRGLTISSQTDAVFAVDVATNERTWTYRGKNILHTTIAIGPECVYFIDSSISTEERQRLYLQDKGELKKLTGEAAKKAEEEMKRLDVRMAVALDRKTGEQKWARPVNVTDTTNISAGGGSLTVMYADGHLVLCGANANGHYWRQFLAGEFEKRKLLVLDAESGRELWSKNANYMNRPAVIGNEVFAEPWAFNLHTGEPKKRPHPVTGEESQWRFSRPGHHCGVITATPNMMFFRSGFIGYYDLYNDSGTRHFSGQRLGCWVNAIPGNGLVMIPEASAGCVCQFSIASTVVLEPKSDNRSWGIFSAVGASTPVKRLGINFGAPGDRKDLAGREWFGFPRPNTRGRLEYVFDIKPRLENGGGWYSNNSAAAQAKAADLPWVHSSGARGLKSFSIPILGRDDEPRDYQVTLHFPKSDNDAAKQTEVQLNGAIAVSDSDELSQSLSRTFKTRVEQNLTIELTYPDNQPLTRVTAIEIERIE